MMIAGETDRAPFRRDSNNLAGRDTWEDPYSKEIKQKQKKKKKKETEMILKKKEMWTCGLRRVQSAADLHPRVDGSSVKHKKKKKEGPIKLLHLHPFSVEVIVI